MSWHEEAIGKTRVFMENMVAEALLAQRLGLEPTPAQVVGSTLGTIVEIAEETFPLARLMDASDLVFHAEGPGAAHGRPWLSALAWLLGSVDRNVRRLSAALFDLWNADGNKLASRLDIRTPGFAVGSIWTGVKIDPPPGDLLAADLELVGRLTAQLGALPQYVRYIGNEGLRPGIEDYEPDPALRDAQLGALFRLAPTGGRGIHTLALSARESGTATLSQRERVVLREVIAQPVGRAEQRGSFDGDVRAADLDKTRLHLRNVEGIGTLRCVLSELSTEHARQLLGDRIRVSGRYQTDRSGRPRILYVEEIQPIERQTTLEI